MTLYEDEKPPLRFHNAVWTNSVSKSEPEEIGLYAHEEGVDFIPREMWPDAIKRACFDTWLDDDDNPLREEQIYAFAKRWGSFEPEAFIQMLQQGNETERIFAIFTLGHLAPPDLVTLLTPFLNSPQNKERWASTIALGRGKYELVFTLLQDLLLEDISYYYPCDPNLRYTIHDALEEAERQFGQDSVWMWEELVDPASLQAWNAELANEEELRWFIIHRLTITRLLGKWGDSRAIPMLRQAFHNCQEQLDQGNYPNEVIYEVNQNLSFFQRLLTETINILSSG